MSTKRDRTPPRARLGRRWRVGRGSGPGAANARLRARLEDLGMMLADGEERELVPGVVIDPDGRIALGDNATEPATWLELARFLGHTGRLLWAMARDPRVPRTAKVVAGLAAAYVISPLDLVPDFVPRVGRIDDVYLVVRSLRYLVDAAGYEVVRDLWEGSHEGLALLLGLVGAGHR